MSLYRAQEDSMEYVCVKCNPSCVLFDRMKEDGLMPAPHECPFGYAKARWKTISTEKGKIKAVKNWPVVLIAHQRTLRWRLKRPTPWQLRSYFATNASHTSKWGIQMTKSCPNCLSRNVKRVKVPNFEESYIKYDCMTCGYKWEKSIDLKSIDDFVIPVRLWVDRYRSKILCIKIFRDLNLKEWVIQNL